MRQYHTSAVLPHHLACRIIFCGHIDDLYELADKLHGYIGYFQPIIYTKTPEDELHIFISDIEGVPITLADLLPDGVEVKKIEAREGEVWDS